MRYLSFVFLLLPLLSNADNEARFGDWQVSTVGGETGAHFAATANKAGDSTGVLCADGGNCKPYLNAKINCEVGNLYPLLMSSAAGAASVISTCRNLGDLKLFMINDADAAYSAFESGGVVGYALSMETGVFRSYRFSNTGATPAIKELMKRANKSNEKQPVSEVEVF